MADNSGTLLPVNFLYVTLSIIDFMPPRQLMVEEFAQVKRQTEIICIKTHVLHQKKIVLNLFLGACF